MAFELPRVPFEHWLVDESAKGMKILFLSQDALTPTGIGTQITTTARALAARGHEVHVLSCLPQNVEDDEMRDGYWIHRRRRLRVRGLWRLHRAPLLGEALRRLRPPDYPPWTSPALRLHLAISNYRAYQHLGIDFDLIETPEHLAESLVFAVLGTKPVVVDLHGPLGVVVPYWGYRPGWHLRVSDRLERLAAARATVTIAPSRFVVRELAKAGWRGARRARVVPHTIDPTAWSNVAPVSGTGPVILSVGEIGPLKASDVLVKAAGMLTHRNGGVEVAFVGPSMPRPDGTASRDVISKLAAELGVRCRFGEHVPRDELATWYGKARVVAVPSRFESFSQVGLEALAAGRPVVCSMRTGLAEVAGEAGGAISVVPADDVEALAGALEPLLADRSRAAELGLRGRAFVEERSEQIVARREAVYLEAIELWRGRPMGGEPQ